MFRKLSLALAVSAALSSTGALALGLGEISTKSALNQNFNADIALVAVGPGELDGMKVTLASPADFARRGLDRPYLLSKLRFKAMELEDGQSVIRVTTKEPVREPFLNFLVEVNWPKGRLIREFTVLLDPPVTLKRMPPPTMAAVSNLGESPQPMVERAAPAERYVPSAAAVPPPAPLPPLPAAATSGQYGPVPRGATLWRIASELAVPGASTEQVMMALFRANPHAFAGNNVNNLQAGAILRVPTQETIFSLSPRQAKTQFRDQTNSWTGPEGAAPPPAAGHLEIASAPPQGAPGSDMERVKSDLMMVKETGESTRQETEELRSRIRELEAQLADIREMLKLKSDQLAALQASRSMPTEPAVEEVEETQEKVPVEELPAEPAGTTEVVEEVEKVEVQPTEPEVTPAQPPKQPAEPVVAEAPVKEPAAPQKPPQVQLPEKAPPAVAPKQPVAAARAPEQSMLDSLLSNPIMLGIAAAVVVVMLSLVWLLIKRRRETESQFDESVLLAPNDSTTVELDRESEVAESVEQEETSFISDFSPSDIDALQEETGEVDPAAEADVYIAYGRYQQAESLINQAIDKHPDRLDLKMKLLEIYFTTRNVRAFTDLAERLDSANAPEKDPQLWARVQSMGRELVPGHELFAAGGAEDVGMAPVSAMGGDSEEMLVTDSEALSSTMDLDLDTELSGLAEASQEFSGFDEGSVLQPPEPPPQKKTPAKGQEEDSEFAIDLSDLETLEDIDVGDLTMDSEEMSMMPPSQQADSGMAPTVVGEPESLLNESEFELSQFDIGEPEASGFESEPLSEVLGDVGEEEEDTGTKLDLARAYIEMGDAEGAREFLEEVLEEGSEEQKNEAKALLDKIH